VGGDPYFFNQRAQIMALAARDAVATISAWREFPVAGGLSTPEQKCIGWPEQKYISDVSRKAPETGVFCSGIRLGSDYLPTYPR
jgi:hypothetical protein